MNKFYFETYVETPGKLLLINMLIAGEDHRFKYHPGVDIIAICRAIFKNLIYGTHEGGSTIEQQLVRVVTGRYERTIGRKCVEILNAIQLSLKYDKKTIAWNYLLNAYYGTYYKSLPAILSKFDCSLDDDIPINVCAEIVARLKYPEPKLLSCERAKVLNRRAKYILGLYYKYSKKDFFLFK